MKYLNVSTGRCGSTLLSSIMARAGADFGLDEQKDWQRTTGSYEHPRLDSAYKWQRAGDEIHLELWPFSAISSWCYDRRDSILNSVFNDVNYAKSIELVHLIQPIHQLDYKIQIILTYRRFNGFARSWYRRFGWELPRLVEHYQSVNKTGLLQLQTFGGCAISFEELTDPGETDWAKGLGELTGISTDALLTERDDILKEPRHDPIVEPLDQESRRLYDRLSKLGNRVITPSLKESNN